jgi:rare lipoprotein A
MQEMTARARVVLALLIGVAACATTETTPREERARPSRVERGKASYYAKRFHGRKTASGERFDVNAMTGAHRKLPFGTKVKVTNVENGRSVVVTINDRGPFARGRVIDLTPAAARKIEMIRAGIVRVTVEVLSLPSRCARSRSC